MNAQITKVMPTPTPHMNGGHRSKLPVLQSSTSSNFPTNLKRTNDELRQHISRLKAELEVEKAKTKQVHRDRVADIKKLKDQYDKEKLLAQTSTNDKVKAEHELEIKKLKEVLQKEKEVEIKHLLKFKDEELRATKKMLAEDKELSLKEQDETMRREFNCKSRDSVSEIENKLRQELNECRKQKQQFEELYKQKAAADSEKGELLRKLKEEHEKENQRVLRDARIQIARNVHELKAAQKAVAEKEQEITKREIEFTRLGEEKDQLLEKFKDAKQNGEMLDTGTARTEKEWELQLKNMELKKKVDELSKKLNLLEKEASGGKTNEKDGDLLTKYEHRTKELRKRNGELVNLARKLEDKAKRLQEELKEVKSRSPNVNSAGSEPQSTAAFENFKKTYTMQRARDLAEHAKVSMTKDKEIAELKKKIADLEEQISSFSGNAGELERLEMTVRQVEKEKLRLEKQFADKVANEQVLDDAEVSKLKKKIKDVEMENEKLEELVSTQKKEITDHNITAESLIASKERCEELQILLQGKEEQCRTMATDLRAKEQAYQDLEKSLSDLNKKNMEIERENEKNKVMVSTLQNKLNESSKRLVQLESLEREYKNLQERLSDAENQCVLMRSQLEMFQEKVKNFKKLEEDLKQSEEKCTKWEKDYDYAVDKINKQNKEISELCEAQKSMQDRYSVEIEALKDEITRLEDICVDLESKENGYMLKLQLKEDELKNMRVVPTNHVYVQTSRPHTPMHSQGASSEEIVPDADVMLEAEPGLEVYEDLIANEYVKQSRGLLLESESDGAMKSDDDILDIASSRIAALAMISSSDGDFSREDELPSENIYETTKQKAKATTVPRAEETKITRHSQKPVESGDTSDELSLSLDEMSDDDGEYIPLTGRRVETTAKRDKRRDNNNSEPSSRRRIQFEETEDSKNAVLAPVITYSTAADPVANDSDDQKLPNAVQTIVDKLSVFIAKYTYDPFKHSPNDDPSLELAIEAGDYVYVFGDADEDGFYTGELVDGQRGLVPSNFVEKIADENELISFSKGYEAYPGDESDEDLTEVTWSCAESINENGKDAPLDAEYFKVTPRTISRHSDNGGLNDDSDFDSGDELEKKQLSPPKNLKVERQLKSSVVISWLPPDDVELDQIMGYKIRADGELRETVTGSDRTKAMISDINRDKTCRITVHCFDKNEKEPEGLPATITVGRGASAAPSDLHIFNLAATCADLEWTCGNSSMAHAVYLNGSEVHVLKPGTDRFKLINLIPDHEYEVNVEARTQGEAYKKKQTNAELMSNGLIFRTPVAGPPEPPLNVQVRVSKPSPHERDNFIIVSWLPVTILDTGTSVLGVITGYKVYMNDKEIIFVDQPTEDHVRIFIRDFNDILTDRKFEFIELWMRTQSVFGESTISNVVILPMAGLVDGSVKHKLETIKNTDVKDSERVSDFNEEGDRLLSSVPKRDIREKGIDANMQAKLVVAEEEEIAAVKIVNQELVKEEAVKEDKEGTEERREAVDKEESALKLHIGKERIKTKQAKVIRYDVSDDSEESDDENDSDDEDQCVFNILEEDHKGGSGNEAIAGVHGKGDVAIHPKEPVPENLILPSLPIRDDTAPQGESNDIPPPDYPDAIEVKPRKHFPLDELLSTSDSELSAIEEETVEDLLEYNKDGSSRPTSKTHNLLSVNNSISRQSTDHVTMEDEGPVNERKLSENLDKTFSIHSEDDKNKTYSVDDKQPRRSSDKLSEKKSSQTSKDSLTFSSDDVMDLLDKDIIGNVPDLPRDDDKESVVHPKSENRPALISNNKRKESDIPVTDLSDLSCDNEIEEIRAGKEEARENFDVKVADASAKDPDMQRAVGSDDLPAKQTPVESKDQKRIDAMQPSKLWTEKASSAISVQFVEGGVSVKATEAENQTPKSDVAKATVTELVVRNGIEENATRAESEPNQTVTDVVRNDLVSNSGAEVEVDGENSMGQGISLNQSSIDLGDAELNDEDQIKAPLTSVHDLYTLNTIDSFEDSESEVNAEFNPYFAPVTVQKSADEENLGLGDSESDDKRGDSFASSLTEQPAIQNGGHTEHPAEVGNTSIAEASGLNRDEAHNNGRVSKNERSIEDTRSNHVDEETKPNNIRVFIALFTYDPITMSPNTDGVDEELSFAEGDLIKIFGECDEDGFYYGELRDKCGFVPSNMVQEVNLGDIGDSFNIPPPEEDISGDTEEPSSADLQTGFVKQSQTYSEIFEEKLPNRLVQESSSTTQGAITESGGKATEPNTEVKEGNTRKMDDIITSIGDIAIEESNPDYRYISERDSIYCLPPRRMIALYDYDPAISSPNVDSEVELAFSKGDIIVVFGDMDEDGFYAAQSNDERGLVPSNFLTECPELSDSEEIEIDIGAASPSIQTPSRKSSAASVSGASPVDSPKTKKKKGLFAKGKKIFSKLKGK